LVLIGLAGLMVPYVSGFVSKTHDSTGADSLAAVGKAMIQYDIQYQAYPDDLDSLIDGSAGGVFSKLMGPDLFGTVTLTSASGGVSAAAFSNVGVSTVQDMDEDTTKSATFESNTGSRSIADGDELAVINIVTSGMSGTTATLDTDLSRELGGYTIDSANNNYVVFGVGSNSSMIGKTIHEAPVHFAQTGTMSAEKKYNRLVAVFEVPKTYMASMGDMRRPKFIGTLMPMMRLEGKSGALDSHYSSIDQ